MDILDDVEKIQTDARAYLDSLGADFLQQNKGKTLLVFPYIKERFLLNDPLEASEITNQSKYQKETSYIFNL